MARPSLDQIMSLGRNDLANYPCSELARYRAEALNEFPKIKHDNDGRRKEIKERKISVTAAGIGMVLGAVCATAGLLHVFGQSTVEQVFTIGGFIVAGGTAYPTLRDAKSLVILSVGSAPIEQRLAKVRKWLPECEYAMKTKECAELK
jgi:hypothetical protein